MTYLLVVETRTLRNSDLLDMYQLQQHIKNPTRTTSNTKTLIDLTITKVEDSKIIDTGVIGLGISDHNLVCICRKVSVPKQGCKTFKARQFKNCNASAFQMDLSEALSS